MIRFACGACSQKFSVPDRHAGRRGKCPKCGSVTRVPAMIEAPPLVVDAVASGTAAAAVTSAAKTQTRARRQRAPRAGRQPAPVPIIDPSPEQAPAEPAGRKAPGLLDRLTEKMARTPAPGSKIDVNDIGGIPRAVKIMFVVGILVLLPLMIGAAFIVLILLRVKLGS